MKARIAVIVGGLLVAGCATDADRRADEQIRQNPASADTFRIVDCLLPPEVRKVGAHAVFLGPARAIRTTPRDCEGRGGEYAADAATALRFWLSEAEKKGDPAALTRVGEIFEKGPGGVPDYRAAADWYRRAAEKGYARAAVNLGALYERGLGVPRDPQQAIAWYRRAAGLPGLTFGAEAGQATEELRALQARTAQLEKALKQRQAEVEVLRRRLAEAPAANQREREQLRARLAKMEAELSASQRESNELRATIDRQRQAPAGQPGGPPGASGGGGLLPVISPPRIEYGTYSALVIGIGEYQNFPRVDTATRDAEQIERVLQDRYGFKVIRPSNPRRNEITEEIKKLHKSRAHDNVLIYYAGRCELEQDGTAYWLPSDAQRDNRETWIPTRDIAENLGQLLASQVMVVADSCYEPRGGRILAELTPPFSGDQFARTIATMARLQSRMVLTSGERAPRPASPGSPHSAFAAAFLQVIQENSGLLVGEQLFRALQFKMSAAASQRSGADGLEYRPILSAHAGGDFIFVRTARVGAAGLGPDR